MYFVVMENVFSVGFDIHTCYDLKVNLDNAHRSGFHSRKILAKEEEKKDGTAVIKDLDIEKGTIKLQREDKMLLAEQISRDCWVFRLSSILLFQFLQCNNIIDYSLLVGVHERDNSRAQIEPAKMLHSFASKKGGFFRSQESRYFVASLTS